MIVDKSHDQNLVKVHGSGRVTLRNRQFLRRIQSLTGSGPAPVPVPAPVLEADIHVKNSQCAAKNRGNFPSAAVQVQTSENCAPPSVDNSPTPHDCGDHSSGHPPTTPTHSGAPPARLGVGQREGVPTPESGPPLTPDNTSALTVKPTTPGVPLPSTDPAADGQGDLGSDYLGPSPAPQPTSTLQTDPPILPRSAGTPRVLPRRQRRRPASGRLRLYRVKGMPPRFVRSAVHAVSLPCILSRVLAPHN